MRSTASGVVLVLLVAALSAAGGCYTVLKHPPSAEVADGGISQRDCFQCHSPSGPAHAYDPMFRPGFEYYSDHFFPFYSYPWWYRDYWLYDTHDYSGSSGDTDDSRRHLWGRGPSFSPPAPFPVGSTPGATTPPAAEAGQEDSGQQPGRTMKGASSGTSGNQDSKGSKESQKEDKKKEDRSVWGRGGNKP
jgi:hypothetical protein